MTKKSKKYWQSAAEFMAELQADPEWVQRRQEQQSRHAARVAHLKAELEPEQAPLLADLADAGLKINSVWDLVNSSECYSNAIPVLCKHLRLVHHPVLREGIARALTVPEARGVAGCEILEELKRENDMSASSVRWALANALTVMADETMTVEIKLLLGDFRYADVHERLEAALERLDPH